jgi:hypothetical protein
MNIDWNIVSNWTAVITACVAILGLILQSKTTKFTLDVDLLVRLEDKFDEEAMLVIRKKAARALLLGNNLDVAGDVFDFFETMGLLLRKGALDQEMATNEFSYWAVSYWMAGQKYIKQVRSKDPNYWINYERLVNIMNKTNKRSYKSSLYVLSKEEVREFLEVESKLAIGKSGK